MRALFYVKADCPHCDDMRRALGAAGVDVEEIDVSRRPEIVPELLKLTRGKRVVPVLVDELGIHIAPRGGSPF